MGASLVKIFFVEFQTFMPWFFIYKNLLTTSSFVQVGPSTFFSSKQFEVFDVELLNFKDCQRKTTGFYSDVVCD
jgi:hypothetical protein